MGRAPCCDKANVKKGPWSPEEDAKLKAYIEEYGTGGNWIALPQKIGLKRCGKSCRLRWLNYLRPNIKHGGFSEEEDNIICNLYISIGSRWSIIAAQLPGRTDNDIKNYWNTRLKKKLLGRRKQSNSNRISSTSQDSNDQNGVEESQYAHSLSNSALERLQLHMHLQSLQNPPSLYANPSMWPKLHPLHEKMVQSLQSLTQTSNLMNQYDHQKVEPYESYMGSMRLEQNLPKITNPSSGMEQCGVRIDGVSTFQAEFDDFINNKSGALALHDDSMSEFDCFKEMEGSKNNSIWWSNELDHSKSASSSSWDSTSVFQPDGMFQDYGLGYQM